MRRTRSLRSAAEKGLLTVFSRSPRSAAVNKNFDLRSVKVQVRVLGGSLIKCLQIAGKRKSPGDLSGAFDTLLTLTGADLYSRLILLCARLFYPACAPIKNAVAHIPFAYSSLAFPEPWAWYFAACSRQPRDNHSSPNKIMLATSPCKSRYSSTIFRSVSIRSNVSLAKCNVAERI